LNIVTTTSYGFTFDPAAPMTVTSTGTLRKFLGEIPSRYREIAIMYERAQVWPVVYVEACLKMARFSITNETGRRWRTEEASIWIARAWNYAGDLLEIGEKVNRYIIIYIYIWIILIIIIMVNNDIDRIWHGGCGFIS
jgi:hypothetical protein